MITMNSNAPIARQRTYRTFAAFSRILLSAIFLFTFFVMCQAETPVTMLVLTNGIRVRYETPPQSLSHLPKSLIQSWLELNVCSIIAYYGRFPLKEFLLVLRPVEGSEEISYGQAMPGKMPRLTIYVGTKATPEEFRSSWVMCHEMTHITFPSLEREHHWLEEGIATYVEPIARAMTGIISIESVWYDLLTKTPDAFANAVSGLDGERDFRRVYWGGALYCLLADIEIRRATKNKHSLQDALQAIMQQEGTMNADRDILTVLRCGDKRVSGSVLEKLYQQIGKAPYKPNLDKLWQDLGIERSGNTVRFRDDAPLAAIRKSICERQSPKCNDAWEKRITR
ncbi:MAG: hypothetical protein ACOVSW_01685 [Candidatus Kapaibacteriota bacterium]|jgi:hypothetical protein